MDGVGTEALEGKGRLRLRAGVREGFPHEAQVQRAGGEQALQEAQSAQFSEQRTVHTARLALLREWAQPFRGEGAQLRTPGGLGWFERECGHCRSPLSTGPYDSIACR